jgi:potassium efflux system protein
MNWAVKRTPTRFRSCSILLAWLLSIPLLASAQPALELTPELIDRRVATLRADGVADDAETLLAYEAAKAQLSQAESHERDAINYAAALTSAVQREAEIQDRLDELDDAYDPVPEVAGYSDEEMRARLALATAEVHDATTALESLDRRLATSEANAVAIRARLSEIDQRLDALPSEVQILDPTAPASSLEANQWRNMAESVALKAERRAQEERLTTQPTRLRPLVAERAELALTLERLLALVRELEHRVNDNLVAAVDPVDLGIEDDDPAHSLVVALATVNNELHRERQDLNHRLGEIRDQNNEIRRLALAVEERFATVRGVADFAGDSSALGRVLLAHWDEVGSYAVDDPTRLLPRMLGSTVISRMNHQDALAQLISTSGYVNRQLRDAGLDTESIAASTRSTLVELTRGYREHLNAIVAAESEYIDALSALDSGYSDLAEKIDEYKAFLESLILWIPNHPPLWTTSQALIVGELIYIAETGRTIRYSAGPALMFAAIVTLLLVYFRSRFAQLQQRANSSISRPTDDSIRFTLLALASAGLRALPIPVLLLGVASVFEREASPAGLGMFNVSIVTAALLFSFSLMRIVSEPSGIGRVHFGWRSTAADKLNGELTYLIRWWLPFAIAAALANTLTPDSGGETIGRLMMMLAMLAILTHLARIQGRELRAVGRAWFRNRQNGLRLLLFVVFLVLFAAIVYGHVFTVTVIVGCLIKTAWIGISLVLLHAVLSRWLLIARRHLYLQELSSQRAAQSSDEDGNIAEQLPDISDVSAETMQLLNVATVAIALGAFAVIWAPLLPVFDAFSHVTLWTSAAVLEGETVVNRITLATLLTICLLAALTLFAARRLPAVVEIILRSRTSVSPGARYATSTLLNYIIIGAGIVAALSALGLDWSQLQWLVAALGVGIGFGLQEIVANFISGLIILFERPIRVGDTITIGEQDGVVVKIRIRATTIRDWDGKELLVPNKEFITGRLLNWTLSNSQTRLVIPVGIAYGSDVEKALRILTGVVSSHPTVLGDPEPSILFLGFGDNSLNLVARCFVPNVTDRMPTTSALHSLINDAFKDAGIVIAFPQRDVHLGSEKPIRIALDSPPATRD